MTRRSLWIVERRVNWLIREMAVFWMARFIFVQIKKFSNDGNDYDHD